MDINKNPLQRVNLQKGLHKKSVKKLLYRTVQELSSIYNLFKNLLYNKHRISKAKKSVFF